MMVNMKHHNMMTVVVVVVNYLPVDYHTGTSNQQKKLTISWKS